MSDKDALIWQEAGSVRQPSPRREAKLASRRRTVPAGLQCVRFPPRATVPPCGLYQAITVEAVDAEAPSQEALLLTGVYPR
jgi:hypothetical protein